MEVYGGRVECIDYQGRKCANFVGLVGQNWRGLGAFRSGLQVLNARSQRPSLTEMKTVRRRDEIFCSLLSKNPGMLKTSSVCHTKLQFCTYGLGEGAVCRLCGTQGMSPATGALGHGSKRYPIRVYLIWVRKMK